MAVLGDSSVLTATFAASASLSDAQDVSGMKLFTFILPAGFQGTALTFQASDSLAGTYVDLYDDAGNEVSVTVAAGRAVAVDQKSVALAAVQYLKIRSGTSASPQVQSSQRLV